MMRFEASQQTDRNHANQDNRKSDVIKSAPNARHIVLFLPTYLPETYGGAEQQSRKFADALLERGIRVTILAPRIFKTTPASELSGRLRIIRFKLRGLPNLGGRHILSFTWWSLRTALWLWHNRHSYDVIHIIHGRLHAVGPLIGAMLTGKPALIKIGRGGDHFDIRVVRRKKLIGLPCAFLVKRLTTGFIANSQEIAQDLVTHGVPVAKVHRIPNGVIMPSNSDARHMAASDATRFVYLGRLDSEKALDWMIEGFAKLPSKAETRLVIVGDGPCGNELKALAIRLGISDRVEFPGRVDDVAPYLETADFYLSTSLSEGMSNALLEAMSYAVPPLVSRVSGVDDMVIDGKSGLLFEAGNIAAYTSKLLAAIAMSPDDRHSMGQAAAATVRDRFGMDKVTDQHIALYDSLMATKTASAIRQ